MNIDQLTGLAPIIAIAVTAVAVMIGIAVRRHFVQACAVAACGIIMSLLILGVTWRENPIQATLLLRMDAYAQFCMELLFSSGLARLGFCYDYFKEREGENGPTAG